MNTPISREQLQTNRDAEPEHTRERTSPRRRPDRRARGATSPRRESIPPRATMVELARPAPNAPSGGRPSGGRPTRQERLVAPHEQVAHEDVHDVRGDRRVKRGAVRPWAWSNDFAVRKTP